MTENRIVHTPLQIDPENIPSLYVLGIKKHAEHGECPRQNLTVGGFTFSVFSEEVTRLDGEPISRRTKKGGQLNWLTDADVDKLNKALKTKVFRGRRLLSRKSRNYRPHYGDIPISAFLYIHKVNEHTYRRPMIDEDILPDADTRSTKGISEALVRSTDALDELRRIHHKNLKQTGNKLTTE